MKEKSGEKRKVDEKMNKEGRKIWKRGRNEGKKREVKRMEVKDILWRERERERERERDKQVTKLYIKNGWLLETQTRRKMCNV